MIHEDETEEWNIELLHENYASGLSSWKKHMKDYSKKIQRGSSKQNSHCAYSRRNCPCCSASKHIGRSLHHTNKPLKHEGSFLSFIPDEFYESSIFTTSNILEGNALSRKFFEKNCCNLNK